MHTSTICTVPEATVYLQKNKLTPAQEATLSSTAFKLLTAVQDGLCFPARPENLSYAYPMDFPPILGKFDHDLTTTVPWESLIKKGNHSLLWP